MATAGSQLQQDHSQEPTKNPASVNIKHQSGYSHLKPPAPAEVPAHLCTPQRGEKKTN